MKFCLMIYQLFNYCAGPAAKGNGTNAKYQIVDIRGRYLVQAKLDDKNRKLILRFEESKERN